MSGVFRELAEYRLYVDFTVRSVRERLCRSVAYKRKVIREEVVKLLVVNFIYEIYYSEWFVNVVMVFKKDKSFRTCIDFKYVNKVCPKDYFSFFRID